MEITGRIKKIFETQNITASFKKREFVVTTQEQYPQDIMIEFTQDKTGELDRYQEGQEWINPEGVAKYFNTIQAWRIENMANSAPNPAQFQDIPASPPTDFKQDQDDDLPF